MSEQMDIVAEITRLREQVRVAREGLDFINRTDSVCSRGCEDEGLAKCGRIARTTLARMDAVWQTDDVDVDDIDTTDAQRTEQSGGEDAQ